MDELFYGLKKWLVVPEWMRRFLIIGSAFFS